MHKFNNAAENVLSRSGTILKNYTSIAANWLEWCRNCLRKIIKICDSKTNFDFINDSLKLKKLFSRFTSDKERFSQLWTLWKWLLYILYFTDNEYFYFFSVYANCVAAFYMYLRSLMIFYIHEISIISFFSNNNKGNTI